jgi:hypothetical protein
MKRADGAERGTPQTWLCWFLGVLLLSCFIIQASASAQQNPALNNQDVIDMVKAGIPEPTILLLIQQSPGQFATGARDLIALQNAGVPAAIMDAMMTKGSAGSRGPQVDERLVPTAYGYYAVANGNLLELSLTPVDLVFGLTIANRRGLAVDGFDPSASPMSLEDPTAYFVVYGHELNPNVFTLARLDLLPKLRAGQFNILDTQPQFFQSVFGVPQSQEVTINLLRPKDPIGLRVEPMAQRDDMYRLVPEQPLSPGESYALYTNDNLRPYDVVFTASIGQAPAHGVFIKMAGVAIGEEAGAVESNLATATATASGGLEQYLTRPVSESGKLREDFRDQKLGIGFSHAVDFNLQPGNAQHTSVILTPGDESITEGLRTRILVEAGKTPMLDRNPSVESIVDRQVAATRNNLENSVLTGPRETTLAGYPAQVVFIAGLSEGRPLKQAITIGVGSNRWMRISLVAPEDEFESYLDEYRRICESMTLY